MIAIELLSSDDEADEAIPTSIEHRLTSPLPLPVTLLAATLPLPYAIDQKVELLTPQQLSQFNSLLTSPSEGLVKTVKAALAAASAPGDAITNHLPPIVANSKLGFLLNQPPAANQIPTKVHILIDSSSKNY